MSKTKHNEYNPIETALEESRKMLKMVINNVPQYVFWKDENCMFLGCNQNFADAIQIQSPNDIIGKTDFDIVSEDKAKRFIEIDKQIMKTNKPIYNMVESHKNKNDDIIWVNINKIPLHDIDGNIIGILGTVDDITQRVKMNNKIKLSEEKYRNLIEFTNTAYIIMDLDLQILETNKNFANIIGAKSLDTIIGRNPRSWIYVNDITKFDNNFKSLRAGELVNDIEINLITMQNQMVYVNLTSNIIENGQRKIFCLLRDISYKRIRLDSKRITEQKRKDKLIQSIRAIQKKIKKGS